MHKGTMRRHRANDAQAEENTTNSGDDAQNHLLQECTLLFLKLWLLLLQRQTQQLACVN